MTWDVEYTDEFGDWWAGLTEDEQASVAASVQLLEVRGAALGQGKFMESFWTWRRVRLWLACRSVPTRAP